MEAEVPGSPAGEGSSTPHEAPHEAPSSPDAAAASHITLNEAIAAHTAATTTHDMSEEEIMSSLGFSGSLPSANGGSQPPDVPPPDAEYISTLRDAGVHAPYDEADPWSYGSTVLSGADMDFKLPTPSTSLPNVVWREDAGPCFGSAKSICIGAWCIFLTLPLLYFVFVSPPAARRRRRGRGVIAVLTRASHQPRAAHAPPVPRLARRCCPRSRSR
jgi:hypothetical protein